MLKNSIEVMPIGAGSEIGRSCIIVKIFDKRIMLDFGMHMGYNDNRKFPDIKKFLITNNS